jgi:hypothetical protein
LRQREASAARREVPTSPQANRSREIGDIFIRYAFETLNLNKLYGYIHEDNTASAAFAERNGFQRTGVRPQHVFKAGRFYDVWEFSLLRADWHARRLAQDVEASPLRAMRMERRRAAAVGTSGGHREGTRSAPTKQTGKTVNGRRGP